ncbi:MAG TPA: efflux RND transporter periplasmic adaptor subunit [Gemmatimonadota bacterium]
MLVVGTAACGGPGGGGDADDAGPDAAYRISGDTVFVDSAAAELVGIDVGVPPHREVGDWIETTGRIEADPAARSDVTAPAEGRIDAIAVRPGDRVARGRRVARFSSPEFLAGAVDLRAPRGGTVTAVHAAAGAVVAAGTPILEIADLGELLLVVDVFPEMRGVRAGLPVEAELPGSDEPVRGEISALSPQTDSATQTVGARVPLRNRDGSLRPGTFVRARVRVGSTGEAVILPAEAVVRDSVGQRVYVPAGGGYAPLAVTATALPGDSVAVTGGLEAGRRVVLRGAYELQQAGFTFRGLETFGEEAEEEEEP